LGTPKTKSTFLIQQGLQRTGDIFEGKMMKSGVKQAEFKEKKADAEVTKKAVKNLQSKVEKSTLGDLGVLANLKAKMESDAADTAAAETKEEPKSE
jgi:hypothetical protein